MVAALVTARVPLLASSALLFLSCHLPSDLGALVPPTADQDPNLPRTQITVAGHTRWLHLQTFGDPSHPVLFLIHGGAGGDYEGLLDLAVLADEYFVVAWDQRGSGLSERLTREEISLDHFDEELDVLRQRYSPNAPVTLVGHSWGGMYAVLYASRHPKNVQQMALLEPGPLDGDARDAQATAVTFPQIDAALWMDQLVEDQSPDEADYLANLHTETPPTSAGCVVTRVRSVHDATWRLGSLVADQWSRELREPYDLTRPAAWPGQILLVASDCSSIGTAWQTTYAAPFFVNPRVVTIANANHSTILFRPETITALRGYLAAYRK